MKRQNVPWFVIQCLLEVILLSFLVVFLVLTLSMVNADPNSTSFPAYGLVPHLLFVTILPIPLSATLIAHIKMLVQKNGDLEMLEKRIKFSFFWQLAALVFVFAAFVFAIILRITGLHFLSFGVFAQNAPIVFSVIAVSGVYPAAFCLCFRPRKSA